MEDLIAVFDFCSTVIGLFLSTMLGHWFTTIIVFIALLGGVVAAFIAIRGVK